jgi:hypothetical protein
LDTTLTWTFHTNGIHRQVRYYVYLLIDMVVCQHRGEQCGQRAHNRDACLISRDFMTDTQEQ